MSKTKTIYYLTNGELEEKLFQLVPCEPEETSTGYLFEALRRYELVPWGYASWRRIAFCLRRLHVHGRIIRRQTQCPLYDYPFDENYTHFPMWSRGSLVR